MPVNCRCARMLIEAEKLNVVGDVLTIIAIIENGSMINFKRNIEYSDFTIENRSDLLAELDIYNMIENRKITNLKEAGINSKNFFKAKTLREKLAYSISDTIDPDKSTGNTYNIIKALFSGMIENLCRVDFGWQYDTANTIYNTKLQISKNTCVLTQEFVFGFPITIQYKGRFDETREVRILQFVTNVDKDTMFEYIRPTMITEEYIKDKITFDPVSNAFIVTKFKMFYDLHIDTCQDIVYEEKNPEEFAKIKEIWDSIPAELKKETHVRVGPFFKPILGLTTQYIELTTDELQQISDDIDRVYANNRFVLFYCNRISNVSLKTLRKNVFEADKDNKIKKFMSELPNKTGKLETITEWFESLGEVHLDTLAGDITLFTGLSRDKGSIFIKIFDTKNEADESTKEVLEFLIMREVNQKYQDKKFKIKTADGRKIETKASRKAKEEFYENVRMVISEVDTHTFSESLEYLQDVFDEIQETLENN